MADASSRTEQRPKNVVFISSLFFGDRPRAANHYRGRALNAGLGFMLRVRLRTGRLVRVAQPRIVRHLFSASAKPLQAEVNDCCPQKCRQGRANQHIKTGAGTGPKSHFESSGKGHCQELPNHSPIFSDNRVRHESSQKKIMSEMLAIFNEDLGCLTFFYRTLERWRRPAKERRLSREIEMLMAGCSSLAYCHRRDWLILRFPTPRDNQGE